MIGEYTPMKHLKINCQKHKIGNLVSSTYSSDSELSSRCMTNYMKTCSFLYAYFTETMKEVENLFLKKKLMVKNYLFLKKVYGEKLSIFKKSVW